MHFTREPTIETIITSREGFKLVLRPASGSGTEEFFVDMVEVISFGGSCFYRSLDKPKSFMVPAADYEIVEVREARMVLKSVAIEKEIKIAGGKEQKKEEPSDKKKRRPKKKKDRGGALSEVEEKEEAPAIVEPKKVVEKPSLIPPPSTLISDDIARYKEMTAIEELALENTSEEPREEPREEHVPGDAGNDQVLP